MCSPFKPHYSAILPVARSNLSNTAWHGQVRPRTWPCRFGRTDLTKGRPCKQSRIIQLEWGVMHGNADRPSDSVIRVVSQFVEAPVFDPPASIPRAHHAAGRGPGRRHARNPEPFAFEALRFFAVLALYRGCFHAPHDPDGFTVLRPVREAVKIPAAPLGLVVVEDDGRCARGNPGLLTSVPYGPQPAAQAEYLLPVLSICASACLRRPAAGPAGTHSCAFARARWRGAFFSVA